ncbi:SMI1/KNR4 family protein [Agarivorans sp. JK6]|uniref:SMI1/KNR4 family protein n=1 Tax=Agarivorans sp. JK6 TaxID=2997426 RepID=UPI0038733376
MLESVRKSLKQIAPKIIDSLLPAATHEEIEELQSLIKSPLPSDLITLYKETAGNDPESLGNFAYGVPFLNIQKLIDVLRGFDFEDDSNALRFAEQGIRKEYTLSKSRIHIGDNWGNCVISVDLNPNENGDYGQVILVDYEMHVALKLASSVGEYIINFESDLIAGKYGLAEDALDDGVHWLEPERAIDPCNWYNSPTWKYVKTS